MDFGDGPPLGGCYGGQELVADDAAHVLGGHVEGVDALGGDMWEGCS